MSNFSVIPNGGEEVTNIKNEVPSLLPILPALSAQACPITIIRENSMLTKRISYSENLKERHSFQFQKPVRSDKHGREITFYKCHSTFGSVTDSLNNNISKIYYNEDRTINSLDESLCQGTSQSCMTELNKNLQMEVLKQKNSFNECQQIFMKIQRKLNNKTSKKSKSKNIRCVPPNNNNGELLGRQKRKQKISAARLFKAEHGNENDQNSTKCSECKQYQPDSCCIKIKKKNIIKEQPQREKRKVLQEQCKCSKTKCLKEEQKEIESDHNSIDSAASVLKCIYYSEKQSNNVDDVPGAPPCTPNEVIVNGIASLADIKSQRNVQHKLRDLRDKHAKKEKQILEAAKVKEIERKLEEKKKLMETQRRQIYAINKILADIEYNNFLKSKTQIQGLPV